jgi:hypothetical protein
LLNIIFVRFLHIDMTISLYYIPFLLLCTLFLYQINHNLFI